MKARASWGREMGLVDLAEGFAVALLEELDFRVEARNTHSCRGVLEGDSIVRISAVHGALSTDPVLVLKWMEGVPLRKAAALIAHHDLDRTALARRLLRTMLRRIMVSGGLPCRPHPGNVFVRADGTLALIDFGSVGRLDALQQSALLRALLAMSQRDPRQLRDALLDFASVPSATDEDLERALGQVLAQRLAEGMQPNAALFTGLLNLIAGVPTRLPAPGGRGVPPPRDPRRHVGAARPDLQDGRRPSSTAAGRPAAGAAGRPRPGPARDHLAHLVDAFEQAGLQVRLPVRGGGVVGRAGRAADPPRAGSAAAVAAGAANRAIAEELMVTLDTVKRHVSHRFSKLEVANRTQAVVRARELGLLP